MIRFARTLVLTSFGVVAVTVAVLGYAALIVASRADDATDGLP